MNAISQIQFVQPVALGESVNFTPYVIADTPMKRGVVVGRQHPVGGCWLYDIRSDKGILFREIPHALVRSV